MRRLGRMAGAKALAATTALAAAAIVMASTARSDIYNYTYTRNTSNQIIYTGSFSNDNIGYWSSNIFSWFVRLSFTAGTVNGSPITGFDRGISINNGFGQLFSSVIYPAPGSNSSINANTSGNIAGNASSFSFGNSNGGVFSAIYSGPSGGGGSGGAPTPEVNAGLGMLLAGASFAFLRRKRGGRHAAVAA